ncbi:hypothetical protein RZE82_01915 [Mollicutes bacterium LVI A0039]|nr:hypothetical protein RZE82_01915 [Mollicutes bacterium LVI A0039]
MNKFNKEIVIRITLITLGSILVVFLLGKLFWYQHVKAYSMTINEQGLEILNAYEFPTYLIEEDNCMRPYDIGDGVITFGPGITYQTEQDGINDINERFNTKYTLKNNCIDLDILNELQLEIMGAYEAVVNDIAIKKFHHFTQDQFNALVLMSYNSPALFEEEEFVEAILDDSTTQAQYIEAANNYYKQLNAYYDNPNTEEKNDGFGEGWYNRILDSSEVYFGLDYEFQNNDITKNKKTKS